MYKAYITQIKNVRKHTNADRLQIGECFGNSVIVDLSIQEGQIGIYFPTDGQLGIEYATKNNLIKIKDANGNVSGGYLDAEKRNITTLKLRGEKSDGLFMPLESLSSFTDITKLNIGDPIDILNGVVICQKYIPIKKVCNSNSAPKTKSKKDGQQPKTKYPFFEEHKDTAQLAYCLGDFKAGDICYITLKMNGTSGRTALAISENPRKQNFVQKILKIKPKIIKEYKYISGTRRVVLANYDSGYYGSDLFRKKWHDFFVGKLQKGEEIFYEIVGYTDSGKFIMSECDNSLTKDKEFIKQYGKKTQFTYGCEPNESDIYVYRMTITNEDGYIVEYPTELVVKRCEQMGAKFVPIFDKFIYTTKEDLLARVDNFVDGADPIGKNHIREGVVVRIDNSPTFKAYKSKNFYFKCLEGISKATADAPDIEEAQDLEVK